MSVEDAVMEEIALVCAIDQRVIRADALVVEYDLDSVRAMELVIALEDRFAIAIEDSEVARMRTVRDVVLLVSDRLT